jgi:hypothetical protein
MGNEFYDPAEDAGEPDLTEAEIEEVRCYAFQIRDLSMAHKIIRLIDMVTELQEDLAQTEIEEQAHAKLASRWMDLVRNINSTNQEAKR